MSAGFLFPAAARYSNQQVPGSVPSVTRLPTRVIRYSEHQRVAVYAYRQGASPSVYGAGIYLVGRSGGMALLRFTARGQEATWAPWILYQELTVLRGYVFPADNASGALPVVPSGVPRGNPPVAIPLVRWRVVGLAPGDPTRRRALRHVHVSVPARTLRTLAFVVTRFAIAQDLAAYDIPLPEGHRTWVLGPRGMTGTLVRRARGGETVTLHTATASITWTVSGPSRRAAAATAAPYFPAAGQAIGRHRPPLVHPATMLYRDHQHVAFFADAHGAQRVFGLSAYPFGDIRRTVVMQYTATTNPDAAGSAFRNRAPYWARWIVHRGWTVVLQVFG